MLHLEFVPCPRCEATQSQHLFDGRDFLHGTDGVFSAAECQSCGLWFQNPRPDASSIADAYPSAYAPHTSTGFDPPLEPRLGNHLIDDLGYGPLPMQVQRGWRWWQEWRADVDLIPRFVPKGKLLEIGSASGGRLRALQALGWHDLAGVEISSAAAEIARSSGFEIYCGPVESILGTLPSAKFDVVVASFVIEHLYDPFVVIRECARLIKPGGELLFSTITRDSIDAKIWQAYWPGFDFPRHMVYFNNHDLRRMIGDDFEWISDARHAAPQDFARAAWWRLMERPNLTDRVVGRLIKIPWIAEWGTNLLAWKNLTCRISVRCRRVGRHSIS
jgi:2-polyprenyl-3-methyl-5-hydroxy-6-metoxy-1,4-benzoquinol methylase